MVYVFKAAIQGPTDPDIDAIAEEDPAAASSPSSVVQVSPGGVIWRREQVVYPYLIAGRQSYSMHGSDWQKQTVLHHAGRHVHYSTPQDYQVQAGSKRVIVIRYLCVHRSKTGHIIFKMVPSS